MTFQALDLRRCLSRVTGLPARDFTVRTDTAVRPCGTREYGPARALPRSQEAKKAMAEHRDAIAAAGFVVRIVTGEGGELVSVAARSGDGVGGVEIFEVAA